MPTIAEIAQDDDFSVLLGAINFIDSQLHAGLATTLSDPGTLTVFAPNNAAFGSLAVDLGFTGDPVDADAVLGFLAGAVPVETLRDVVLYHVLPEVKLAADIAADPTLTTALGPTITADLPTLIDNEPDLIDPSLVATDIIASNGVVHVIDKVLLPIDLPGNDAPTVTEIALASGTGFDDNLQDFDILREAVVAADLAGALNDPNADLTVFAPNDAAFVGLAQTLGFAGTDEAEAFVYIVDALTLLSGGNDPVPLLTDILLYHVAPESLQASQVLALDEIPTLLGASLGRDGATLVDGEPDVADPSLIATDIQAANGVLHVLDGVLLPNDLPALDGSGNVDFVIADDANNVIHTGRGKDLVDANGGDDFVDAGRGKDLVLGGEGNDLILGDRGADTLKGEDGTDALFGGRGRDALDGGAGKDAVHGGKGKDVIDGGADDDLLSGGGGADTFVFAVGGGTDVVLDFGYRGKDQIDLTAFGFDSYDDVASNITGHFWGAKIDLDGTEIRLLGADAHALTQDDFIL